jgi:hypothetical protein
MSESTEIRRARRRAADIIGCRLTKVRDGRVLLIHHDKIIGREMTPEEVIEMCRVIEIERREWE